MASLLKNQILKHLSKFTKHLAPDQINLSTLKGEGELTNLELDENILMELMDLPTWMRLKAATCNKVSIKIQWTKLKSQPICLFLDEVVLEIETCDEPRPPNNPAHEASYRSGGKYGFVDRVIDGIFVHINSVMVRFISRRFHATLQLSRVKVQSVMPNWQCTPHLQSTRIRDAERGEILLFKEVDWQTTKVEANAVEGENNDHLCMTPLRFIANQSKIRITMKKRLSDCSIISSRVVLLLDDLLWVLTDSQLKAAILYAISLKDIIEKSTEQGKKLVAEKLQKQGHIGNQSDPAWVHHQQQQQRARSQSTSEHTRLFAKYDVQTTSHHLVTSRIDLHLCDDSSPVSNTNPKHNRHIEGGAVQITFYKLSMDFYPYYPAGGERKNWYRYTDNQGSRNPWVQELFTAFRDEVKKARETCCVNSPSQSPAHHPSPVRSPTNPNPAKPFVQNPPSFSQSASRPRVTKLLESCMVLKIEEFIIYRVSTADQKRNTPQKFLASDKKQLHLPSDMSVVHVEFTDYFFTEGTDYPVPHANLYILVNPVRLTVDYLTVLWINYFLLNLTQNVNLQSDEPQRSEHVDIKIEALLPRIIIPSEYKVENQPERPAGLQIQASKLMITNTHVEEKTTNSGLLDILEQYMHAQLFTSEDFPNEKNDLTVVAHHFHDYAVARINPYIHKYAKSLVLGKLPEGISASDQELETIRRLLKTTTLKRDAAYDIWSVAMDQIWLEFTGVPSSRTRPVPFVESVPLTMWLCRPAVIEESEKLISDLINAEKETLLTESIQSNASKVPNGILTGDAVSFRGLEESETEKSFRNLEESENEQSFDSFEQNSSHDREKRQTRQLLKQYYKDKDTVDQTDQVGKIHVSRTELANGVGQDESRPSDCDNLTSCAKASDSVSGETLKCEKCKLADINIVAKIGAKIRAQLNHFQYMFLMRMLESFSTFQSQLAADSEHFESNSDTNSITIVVPLVVPEVEFAMVCPYVAELLQFMDMPPMSPGVRSNCEDDSEDPVSIQLSGSSEPIIVEDDDAVGYEGAINIPSAPGQPHLSISKSFSDSKIHVSGHGAPVEQQQAFDYTLQGVGSNGAETIQRRSSQSSYGLSDTSTEELANMNLVARPLHSAASDSGFSSDSRLTSQKNQSAAMKVNKAADQMKKSFTAGIKNISDKLKEKKADLLDDNLDDLETMSTRTDLSDEDDDFVLLTMDGGEVPAFNHAGATDTASSTDTDIQDESSIYAESTTTTKGKELVSVVMFKLSNTEVLLRSSGADIIVGAQVNRIATVQPGNLCYEDFYSKFSGTKGFLADSEEPDFSQKKYPVKLKYMLGPAAELEAPTAEDRGYLNIKADNCALSFKMSSLTSLTNFIEDEIIPEVMPMHIAVNDLALSLEEDRPSMNVNSPGAIPVELHIHKLAITVGEDGVFHLSGDLLPMTLQGSDQMFSSVETLRIDTSDYQQDQVSIETEDGSAPDSPHGNSEQLKKSVRELLQIKKTYEDKINNLYQIVKDLGNVRLENKSLKDQLRKIGTLGQDQVESTENLKKEKETLERENVKLQQTLSCVEEDLQTVTKEKDSLLQTLRFLQEEIFKSENRMPQPQGGSHS